MKKTDIIPLVNIVLVVLATAVVTCALIATAVKIARATPLSSQGAYLQPAAGKHTMQISGTNATTLQPAENAGYYQDASSLQ